MVEAQNAPTHASVCALFIVRTCLRLLAWSYVLCCVCTVRINPRQHGQSFVATQTNLN